ncbi:MAG: metallophosphoesterase, partial [Planctomycetales bacterium]
ALVNPGSVGQPRDGSQGAAFALWDRATEVVSFHRVDYPVETTMQAIIESDLPRDLEYRLELAR